MRTTPKVLLRLPSTSPEHERANHARAVFRANRCWIADDRRLALVDVAARRLCWNVSHGCRVASPTPTVEFAPQDDAAVWLNADASIAAFALQDGHRLAVVAVASTSGSELWRRNFDAAEFGGIGRARNTLPCWFIASPEAVCLAIGWGPSTPTSPDSIPVFCGCCTVDIVALDARSGQRLGRQTLRGQTLRECISPPDTEFAVNGRDVLIIDALTAKLVPFCKLPGEGGDPLVINDTVLIPWRRGEQIGISSLNRGTGTIVHETSWKRAFRGEMRIRRCASGVALQLGQAAIVALDSSLQPRFELSCRRWINGVEELGNAIAIVTDGDGRGRRLYLFDARTGKCRLEVEPEFCATDVRAIDGYPVMLAALGGQSVLIDTTSFKLYNADFANVPSVMHSYQGHIACLRRSAPTGLFVANIEESDDRLVTIKGRIVDLGI